MSSADRVWNRAALESGGGAPGAGDRALAALLVHGLVMNGGVHHALECVQPSELRAAVDGFAFFGFDDVATFLQLANDDPMLSERTDENEVEANRRYTQLVSDDTQLVVRFQDVFRERPDQFAPVDVVSSNQEP